jgi:hypothetical protein
MRHVKGGDEADDFGTTEHGLEIRIKEYGEYDDLCEPATSELLGSEVAPNTMKSRSRY